MHSNFKFPNIYLFNLEESKTFDVKTHSVKLYQSSYGRESLNGRSHQCGSIPHIMANAVSFAVLLEWASLLTARCLQHIFLFAKRMALFLRTGVNRDYSKALSCWCHICVCNCKIMFLGRHQYICTIAPCRQCFGLWSSALLHHSFHLRVAGLLDSVRIATPWIPLSRGTGHEVATLWPGRETRRAWWLWWVHLAWRFSAQCLYLVSTWSCQVKCGADDRKIL